MPSANLCEGIHWSVPVRTQGKFGAHLIVDLDAPIIVLCRHHIHGSFVHPDANFIFLSHQLYVRKIAPLTSGHGIDQITAVAIDSGQKVVLWRRSDQIVAAVTPTYQGLLKNDDG